MILLIDGGTTNTRLRLEDGAFVAEKKLPFGAGFGLTDHRAYLGKMRTELEALLTGAGITPAKLERAAASGMITSSGGLCEVAHIPAPAGAAELHNGLASFDFAGLAFSLVPGVKVTDADGTTRDVMRGEETETVGLQRLLQVREGAFLLPGSHSKLVFTDKDGRITDFVTMMTGEMVAALSADTILKESVSLKAALDPAALKEGFRCACEQGLNTALFRTRVRRQFARKSESDAYSFFLGAVLSGEVTAVGKSPAETVVIAGAAPLREPTAVLLRAFTDKTVVTVPEELSHAAPYEGLRTILQA